MKPYYYVYNATKMSPPTVKHDTLGKAQYEAERLAGKHHGYAFEILKVIGISQVHKPVATIWFDENDVKPAPF